MTRDEYIERITAWVMPDSDDPDLADEARAKTSLDGVYGGKSPRIARVVRLAWLRGVRRGVSLVWDAKQPVTTRSVDAEAELARLRSKTRVAAEDFAARGVGRAHVEAWPDRSTDWTRMDDGSMPGMSAWRSTWGSWVTPDNSAMLLDHAVMTIAQGDCARAWAVLDEMEALRVDEVHRD